jgi:uncharacterized protein involved in outer membrane biogenesis
LPAILDDQAGNYSSLCVSPGIKETFVAESRSRNRLARNLIIGLLVFVVLYALAGFLFLPWWLQRVLPEQLGEKMGWQADVGTVRVNPFTLSVETMGLNAKDSDGEQVVGFERLFLNLSFFPLLRGTVGFQAIELQEPFIRLDLLEDYSVNFARDWQDHNPVGNESGSKNTQDDGAPPRLYFQKIVIQGGELLFRDFSQQESAEFVIQPLDLTLNDLATWPRDGDDSRYHLQAAIGSQMIDWQGELSIAPIYSRGSLKISDIGYKTLKHFFAPVLPYDLRGGQISLQSDYELQAGESLYLTTSRGVLTLDNLAVATDAQSDETQLTTGTIRIEGIGFDLGAMEAQVGQVTLDNLSLALARDASGTIDWLAPLNRAKNLQPSAGGEASGRQPFRWSVAGITLSDSQVQWQDRQPDTAIDLRFEHVSLSVGKLSDQLAEPVTYKAAVSLASGGKLSLQGQVTPAPFNLEMAMSGTDIALAAFTPYVQEGANLTITGGSLGIDGHLDLDGQKDPLTGTFSGTADITGLVTSLTGEQSSLVSWQTLRLAPIEYNVYPSRLEIGTVTLKQPVVNVVRGQDNIHNLQRIVRSAGDQQVATVEEAPRVSNSSGEPDFIFRIGQVLLDNGSVTFTDRTMSPAFSTSFNKLTGSVSGLSNILPQQGKVAISGVVGQVAAVSFEGEIGTLGSDEISDLKLTMKNLSLPALSPYFGRYAGYGVDSGKLNLNLNYKISGTHIDATNLVVMDRLQLGQAVVSDQAVNAPVKLGLALLRDQDGVIEVDLPISGDLSDPGFGVGKVVMRAFVNLLVKAAASPFSMLGSIAEMAGLSGEELGQVNFPPGSAELADGESIKLKALADALRERPDLLLNIRGGFTPEADGLALLRKDLTNNGKEPLSDDAWRSARDAYVAGEQTVPPEDLSNLAGARAATIRATLQQTYNVPADQLFLREPSGNAEVDDKGQVINSFTLDVR